MKSSSTFVRALLGVSCASAGTFLFACGGDDTAVPVDAGREAAPPDATTPDAGDAGMGDAGSDARVAEAGTDAATPERLLVTMNNTSTSELVALNVATGKVDGRLTFPGTIATTYARGSTPWLLEQSADVVAQLDSNEPWKVLSSWNVALSDRPDGGKSYADPSAVMVEAAGKGYVLRFNRNLVAVIDTTKAADAGAPTKTIDLSPLVQPGDGDGVVEATFGVYVASRHLVYVLLANMDLTKVDPHGAFTLCSTTNETLVAIDTQTDQVTSLGGTGPGGGVVMTGYNPVLGSGGATAVYDAANDRILVLHGGCNAALGDGGPGAVTKRVVEQVVLGTGEAKVLLDANSLDFPGAFAYAGPHDAFIGLGFANDVHHWDPTETTIGPSIANAPDAFSFVYDGAGALLGPRTSYLADGGSSMEIVKTVVADGGTSTISPNPFTDPSGFVGSAELWPHP